MTEPSTNEYRDQRIANMKALVEHGHVPFGKAFARTDTLAGIRGAFQEGREVSAAGRIVTIRNMGKSVFAHIQDSTGRFQVYLQKQSLGDESFKDVHFLDMGDHIGVTGALFTTRTGEQSIHVSSWTFLSKALLPPPEKWHGLKDTEVRYRQRYLDLISNPDTMELFRKRSRMVQAVRSHLAGKGFVEVETPMMQPMAGGATARPFVTHYEALDCAMYLRIAPELYLKRLLVGGFDKVFELNRNFRNEGLSRTHNPEFTMLEIYEAYSDVRGMKELIQGLIISVADEVFGTRNVGTAEHKISLEPPWREATYAELIAEKMGADWPGLDAAQARGRAEARGLEIDPSWDKQAITHEVYEKLVEKSLIQPTFVTRLPASLIPLAKACVDDASCADVFELVICGQEVAPAYTELNDPLEQRIRLESQAGGSSEKIDEDFLTALEHGMPPAGGMGVGIDRLFMILSGQEAIRDVILFPQLRQKV